VLPDYTLTQAVKTGANTNRWILLTAKFDSTRGTVNPTRDIELSINGTKVGLTLVTNTWNLSSAGTNLPNVSCFFGNDSDGLNPGTSGTQLAAGIVFNYWINGADQLRIENFFKHYYGIRF